MTTENDLNLLLTIYF